MKWLKRGGGGGGRGPHFVWDVTKLHKVSRKVLDKTLQAPVLAEINYHRWVAAGSNETKANSAQFGLNLCLAGLSLGIKKRISVQRHV